MKNVEKNMKQGSVKRICQGLAKTLGVSVLGAAVMLTPLGPTTAKADSSGVSQFQYLQTLAQLTGDSGQFSSSSTAADYVHWAQSKGMNPSGGWQPGAGVTKKVVAETLVALFNLNPSKFAGDYARILTR